MTFQELINQDVKAAMLARDAQKLSVLRMLKAALMNAAIEKRSDNEGLSDVDALAIVRKETKKRQDAIDGFEKGGRQEMADNERAELAILSTYLPKALSADEIEAIVRAAITEAGATSRQQMGAVMKIANAQVAGRADGRTLSAEIQKQLSV